MGLFSGISNLIAPVLGAAGGFALGGPAGALAGGMIGANISGTESTNQAQRDIANDANQFSASQAAQQMQFQERMSNTQYQRAVKDMQDAGLNPALAYTQGGAGTPAGASAVGQQAQLRNPTEGLTSTAAQIAGLKADVALKDTMATKNVADTLTSEKQAQYTDALTASEIMRMPGIPESIKKTQAEILNIQSQSELNSSYRHAQDMNTLIRKTGDLPEATSKGTYYNQAPYNPYALRDISQAGSSAANIAKSLNPFKIGK